MHRTRAEADDATAETDQTGTQYVAPADFAKHSLPHLASLRLRQLIFGRAHDEMSRQPQRLFQIGFRTLETGGPEFGFEEGDSGVAGCGIEGRR